VSLAVRPLRGPVGRRAVVAAGVAGLLLTGVCAAESTDTQPAQPARPGPASPSAAVKLADLALDHHAALAAGMQLLSQAATAGRAVSYRGVQVVSWLATGAGGVWLSRKPVAVSYDVLHHTGEAPGGVLGLTPALVSLLRTHYAVLYTGLGSTAGRPASIVEVLRPDGSVAAQFWLDEATKLPLRRELFDSHAHLLSVSGFVGLTVDATGAQGDVSQRAKDRRAPGRSQRRPAAPGGHRTQARKAPTPLMTPAQRRDVAQAVAHFSDAVGTGNLGGAPATGTTRTGATRTGTGAESTGAGGPGPAQAANGARAANATRASAGQLMNTGENLTATPRPWTDRLGQAQLAALRAQGWPAPAAMPGGLTLYDASESVTSTGRVVDLAYSDGLSVVSLFVQRGQLPAVLPGWRLTDVSGHPLFLRNPAEPDLAWSAGGYVFTVVAAAPAPTLVGVVDSLPHQARSGFWGRMGRGVRRLLSWANPFR
jgi:MucB/RseB N-terminal domain